MRPVESGCQQVDLRFEDVDAFKQARGSAFQMLLQYKTIDQLDLTSLHDLETQRKLFGRNVLAAGAPAALRTRWLIMVSYVGHSRHAAFHPRTELPDRSACDPRAGGVSSRAPSIGACGADSARARQGSCNPFDLQSHRALLCAG